MGEFLNNVQIKILNLQILKSSMKLYQCFLVGNDKQKSFVRNNVNCFMYPYNQQINQSLHNCFLHTKNKGESGKHFMSLKSIITTMDHIDCLQQPTQINMHIPLFFKVSAM